MTVTKANAADFALIDYNPAKQSELRSSGGFTVGSRILIGASNVIVNSLGFQFLNGSSIVLGIWTNAGTLLGTTTATNSSTLYNGYRYDSLSSNLTLTAGQEYVVAAYLPSGVNFNDGNNPQGTNYNNEPYSGNTGVTITRELYDVGAVLTFPTTTNSSLAGRWAPANAAFITPVPEPSTWALGGLSLLALISSARAHARHSSKIQTLV